MTKRQSKPKVKVANEEPIEAPKLLTLDEVKEKIDHYWKMISEVNDYDTYKLAWSEYDYFTDLKTKLLTKTTK